MSLQTILKPYRFSRSLLYLVLICCVIMAVLIVNGYFETKRAQTNLESILENQGIALLEGLEREIQNTLSVMNVMDGVPGAQLLNITSSTSFFALEDTIVDHLFEIATMVDQQDSAQALTLSEIEEIAKAKGVTRIDVLMGLVPSQLSESDVSAYLPLIEGRQTTTILPFDQPMAQEGSLFSVAIRRTYGQGIIVVSVDHDRMKDLRQRFAIQNVLETMGYGQGIQYVVFYDPSLLPRAFVKPGDVGTIEDLSFLQSVERLRSPQSRFRRVDHNLDVFEMAKRLTIGGKPYGILHIGLSTWQTGEILSMSRRNVVVSVVVLLAVGVTGVVLIYTNQSRHFRRLREMEERAQAAERLLSVGRLGAGLAHEIRNPLNAIGMAVQRLHREFLPSQEDQAGEYDRFMNVIRGEIKRLSQMVDRFVLFSKPYTLDLKPWPLADIFDSMSVLFAEEVKARSVVLLKEMDPRIPPIMVDKEKITQALINVVTNSLHAMEGGGYLTVKAFPDRKGWVGVSVSDTGKGISQEEIEKVFDYAYTTREKGLGLGLPIARKIIEEHGGRIAIESEVGRGTTVSMFLPVRGPGSTSDLSDPVIKNETKPV
jgi:signal transduction histidine kinase